MTSGQKWYAALVDAVVERVMCKPFRTYKFFIPAIVQFFRKAK